MSVRKNSRTGKVFFRKCGKKKGRGNVGMDPVNIFEQYYAAEMTVNGRPRHAALVMLIASSEQGRISYEAAVSFFPHDDEEDYAVSYDAYFTRVLFEGKGRRSQKREKELLGNFRQVIDEIAENAEKDETPGRTVQTPGKVCWDRPLRPARGGYELPPLSDEAEEENAEKDGSLR